jgi:hypothetical protein
MRGALPALVVVALAPFMAARTEDLVVIELFTSQGCSSCPPADAILARLTERPDVIPLALHVDYWDYIGWADNFASPAFTKRQKSYARARGARTIYTPQMIVDGRAAVVGHKPMELAERLMQALEEPSVVGIEVGRKYESIDVRVWPTGEVKGEMLLQLVRYDPSQTVAIGRGENAGHTFTYHNIVTDWQTMARWDGREPLTLEHPLLGSYAAVVVVQQAGYGPIVAAARVD